MKNITLAFCLVPALIFMSCKKNKTSDSIPSPPPVSVIMPTIVSPATPSLPASPTIPSLIYSAADYGAVPNDGVDDRVAVQAGVNAVIAAGGGTLEFSGRSL